MRRFILLSILAFPVFAADDIPPPPPAAAASSGLEIDPDDQPDLPPSVKSGQPIEPEPQINIIRKGKQTIEEYRRNGVVYMIKVKPDIGPPYYFIDTNGDGVLDVRRSDLSQNGNVNQWKLLEW